MNTTDKYFRKALPTPLAILLLSYPLWSFLFLLLPTVYVYQSLKTLETLAMPWLMLMLLSFIPIILLNLNDFAKPKHPLRTFAIVLYCINLLSLVYALPMLRNDWFSIFVLSIVAVIGAMIAYAFIKIKPDCHKLWQRILYKLFLMLAYSAMTVALLYFCFAIFIVIINYYETSVFRFYPFD